MKPLGSLLFLLPLLQSTLAAPRPIPDAEEQQPAPTEEEAPPPPPPQEVDTKYFHEPGQDNDLGHYDIRYFKGSVSYEDHRPTLQGLIRSYLLTFRNLGVETWLAHGTLLGWWWNGKIMPWDYDLDVQVSTTTLYYLGKNFNRTVHEYKYWDEQIRETKTKTYLLDVNPHHVERGRGDGMNVIDARWIDQSNGMFIDITGLAEREPTESPGIWSCKNFHRYRTRDLYPMRETEFEGVPATVPYSFDRILTEEYGMKSLVMTEWEGHRWNPDLKEWIRLPQPLKADGEQPLKQRHQRVERDPSAPSEILH